MKGRKHKLGDALLVYKGHEFYDYENNTILHCFRNEDVELMEEIWRVEQYIAFLEEHNISCNATNNGGLYA